MSLRAKAAMLWRLRSTLRPILDNSRTTFSQYGEDLVFDRMLKPTGSGTYVDVGANHPIVGSNTFKLYCRGWSGLAIDPNPDYAEPFRRTRPRDVHLTEGSARSHVSLTYHQYPNDLCNTFDAAIAENMRASGVEPIRTSEVACRPLAEAVDEHLPGRQIDLLNVDCEGFDLEVLESLDLSRRRPTTILVEDFPRFLTFRDGMRPERLERFMRGHGYASLAQAAWAGLYVAEDWRELVTRSAAFQEHLLDTGYMPGQAKLEAAGVTEDERV